MDFNMYPRFTEIEVEEYVNKNFGLKISAKNLTSDIGQNFLLRDSENRKYIFKIANPEETQPILEAQNQILLQLSEQEEFDSPKLYKSQSNKFIVHIKNNYSDVFSARLLSYLEGTFLAELDNHPEELQNRIGKTLGSIDILIEDFQHPAIHRYWHWDLKNVQDVLPKIRYIKYKQNQSLVDYFLLQFQQEVIPKFPHLRQGLIHNDANDFNILINQKNKLGIIDFGDMVHSCIVFELAVALAYIMFNKKNPIEDTLKVVAGFNQTYPLKEPEIAVLFYSICSRLCLSVTMAAYQRETQPDNDYVSVSENNAWNLLWKLIEINPVKAHRLYLESCEKQDNNKIGMKYSDILKGRKANIGKSLSLSFKKPVNIVRGAMQYLFDEEGNTLLDCVNNVSHVGHCHPRVIRAAQKQMALLNTNTRYLNENLVKYAQRLTALFPDPLKVCYFVNSGSEANELTIRLARTFTNHNDFIVLDNAYHGNTSSVIDISPYKFDGPGGKGAKDYIHKVEMPDIFRGPYKADDPEAGIKYAKYVENIIENMKSNNRSLAGFFAEALLGCGGQIVLPDNYLAEAFKSVRNAGGVCIADEVQIGFGRVGSHFWGFETQNVIPDIVTLGKPIGNGHPLGAVVTTKKIADAFDNGMEYFNTYGGNPVSCAVGLTVLDITKDEKLQEHALQVGNYFKEQLKTLQNKYELIGDVRGFGLFLGIELVTNRETLEPAAKQATYIVERMKEYDVQISIDGPLHNVLKIKPPMVFTKANAKLVCDLLDKILQEEALYKI